MGSDQGQVEKSEWEGVIYFIDKKYKEYKIAQIFVNNSL